MSRSALDNVDESAIEILFLSLQLQSERKKVDLAELVNSAANALKLRYKDFLKTSAPVIPESKPSSAIVDVSDFARLSRCPLDTRFFYSEDNVGKAIWCIYFEKLSALEEKPSIKSTVCMKLHQGSAPKEDHDDAQIVEIAGNKRININCKTVTRAAQAKDTPTYQVHCSEPVSTVGGYFVVMWKEGIRKLPTHTRIEDFLKDVHACVLVASSDMPGYKTADSFRINTDKITLTGETELASTKKRRGFSKLKVLGIFIPGQDIDPIVLQNIRKEFNTAK
tara:strand:+ start:1383 stop:2219 length:837 start_codon:yes stop_codon:yes gene_type:complete